MADLDFTVRSGARATGSDDRWHRPRGGDDYPIGGTIVLADFKSIIDAGRVVGKKVDPLTGALSDITQKGVIPAGVAVSYDDANEKYIPFVAANPTATPPVVGSGKLAGFLSVDLDVTPTVNADGTTSTPTAIGASIQVRDVIVPKYLPVAAHRDINDKTPTTGSFVFIKE